MSVAGAAQDTKIYVSDADRQLLHRPPPNQASCGRRPGRRDGPDRRHGHLGLRRRDDDRTTSPPSRRPTDDHAGVEGLQRRQPPSATQGPPTRARSARPASTGSSARCTPAWRERSRRGRAGRDADPGRRTARTPTPETPDATPQRRRSPRGRDRTPDDHTVHARRPGTPRQGHARRRASRRASVKAVAAGAQAALLALRARDGLTDRPRRARLRSRPPRDVVRRPRARARSCCAPTRSQARHLHGRAGAGRRDGQPGRARRPRR